jgi:hypothetical protein
MKAETEEAVECGNALKLKRVTTEGRWKSFTDIPY